MRAYHRSRDLSVVQGGRSPLPPPPLPQACTGTIGNSQLHVIEPVNGVHADTAFGVWECSIGTTLLPAWKQPFRGDTKCGIDAFHLKLARQLHTERSSEADAKWRKLIHWSLVHADRSLLKKAFSGWRARASLNRRQLLLLRFPRVCSNHDETKVAQQALVAWKLEIRHACEQKKLNAAEQELAQARDEVLEADVQVTRMRRASVAVAHRSARRMALATVQTAFTSWRRERAAETRRRKEAFAKQEAIRRVALIGFRSKGKEVARVSFAGWAMLVMASNQGSITSTRVKAMIAARQKPCQSAVLRMLKDLTTVRVRSTFMAWRQIKCASAELQRAVTADRQVQLNAMTRHLTQMQTTVAKMAFMSWNWERLQTSAVHCSTIMRKRAVDRAFSITLQRVNREVVRCAFLEWSTEIRVEKVAGGVQEKMAEMQQVSAGMNDYVQDTEVRLEARKQATVQAVYILIDKDELALMQFTIIAWIMELRVARTKSTVGITAQQIALESEKQMRISLCEERKQESTHLRFFVLRLISAAAQTTMRRALVAFRWTIVQEMGARQQKLEQSQAIRIAMEFCLKDGSWLLWPLFARWIRVSGRSALQKKSSTDLQISITERDQYWQEMMREAENLHQNSKRYLLAKGTMFRAHVCMARCLRALQLVTVIKIAEKNIKKLTFPRLQKAVYICSHHQVSWTAWPAFTVWAMLSTFNLERRTAATNIHNSRGTCRSSSETRLLVYKAWCAAFDLNILHAMRFTFFKWVHAVKASQQIDVAEATIKKTCQHSALQREVIFRQLCTLSLAACLEPFVAWHGLVLSESKSRRLSQAQWKAVSRAILRGVEVAELEQFRSAFVSWRTEVQLCIKAFPPGKPGAAFRVEETSRSSPDLAVTRDELSWASKVQPPRQPRCGWLRCPRRNASAQIHPEPV